MKNLPSPILLIAFAATLFLSSPGTAIAGADAADRIVEKAREAAQDDRNAESMVLFEQAIAEDPARRMVLLPELADQMTYAGLAEEAAPLYQEYLAAGSPSPDKARQARLGLALALSWSGELDASLRAYEALLNANPDDREARLGRARLLSWRDRQGPSKEAYEEVLLRNPGDLEARTGVGRVQSWRGRQRAAQQQLQDVLRDHPKDPEATFLLAQSQTWMGRPDKAQKTLRDYLAGAPEDERARDLLDDIKFQLRPNTLTDYQESHQSDRLTIRTLSLKQSLYLNDGRTMLGFRYQNFHYDPRGTGINRIEVNRPGIYGRHRFSDSFEWNGNVFVDLIDPSNGKNQHETLTYDTYATFWPNDLLRFDFGSSRTTFDNSKSLLRNVTATYANVSMDVTPDEKTRLSLRYNYGEYTDDNIRNWGQVEVERRVLNHPRFLMGWRYTTFKFQDLRDNGYFNPQSYNSHEMTLKTYGRLGDRFSYYFDGGYGVEHANPDDFQAIWNAGTRISYQIVDRLEIEGRYNFFSSATASSGGFERGTSGVNLRFVW